MSDTLGYRNPVVPGFHPDPSVCRVGDEYFLITSSFTYFPGVPIFRSPNLVDWTQIGNILDRSSQLDLSKTRWSSLGIFAPTIRHHDGRFWMITTLYDSSTNNFVVTASDPAGPWSDPVPVAVLGIDPDIAWDDDGNCWVHFSTQDHIARCRIDPNTGAVLDGPHIAWSGTGLHATEAPHLYQRDGLWYLLIAEGGTERGHGVSVARGPSPSGPWESCPSNPILSHRSTALPIQNTGHADLVEAVDGSWWMVLLGVRPGGITPRFHVLGRETYLAPVEWVDGWPRVDKVALEVNVRPPGPIEPVERRQRDDFDAPTLDPCWIAVRQSPANVSSLSARPGWLTVSATDDDLDSATPTFVGRRQQHMRCRVRALVDPGDARETGVCVYMEEHAHYEVAVVGDRIVARVRIGPVAQVLADAPRPAGNVVLVIDTIPEFFAPDSVALGFEDELGQVHVLAQPDGRYLSTEVVGGFIGRVIGMYAVAGSAAFDWFDYREITEPEPAPS